MHRTSIFLITAAACLAAVLSQPAAAAESPGGQSNGTLRIGISSALFLGMPESLVIAVMKPFEGLLIEQTGLNGTLVPSGDGTGVTKGILGGKIDVGVMEGIEFAWAQQKHPELKPLMITINQQKCLKALVVVRKDSPARQFADLKGKSLEEVKNCREHCQLFLRRLCKKAGVAAPDKFFTKITRSDNAEAVLDDLVDNVAQAAVIDNVCFECFRRRKPARFEHLKVIATSADFPASVVVYKDGTLDEATRQKFQQGMLNANRSVLGKQMLTLWKVTAFEMVPNDYEQTLANIVKIYPASSRDATASSQRAE